LACVIQARGQGYAIPAVVAWSQPLGGGPPRRVGHLGIAMYLPLRWQAGQGAL
jgi:hypothetical protein